MRKTIVISLGLLFSGGLSIGAERTRAGDVVSVRKRFDITALREYRRDHHIDVVTDPNAVALSPF